MSCLTVAKRRVALTITESPRLEEAHVVDAGLQKKHTTILLPKSIVGIKLTHDAIRAVKIGAISSMNYGAESDTYSSPKNRTRCYTE